LVDWRFVCGGGGGGGGGVAGEMLRFFFCLPAFFFRSFDGLFFL
jgi:hypothetical protein